VALLVAATVILGLSLAVHALRGGADRSADPGPSSEAVSGPVYLVRAGDTFWDIARMLRPDDDPRPLVARLVAAHGSPVLRVGERIPLPGAA